MSNTELKLLGDFVIRGNVLPEWIDLNKHMNVAFYVLAFDQAVDALWERFGITWQNEMVTGEPFVITTQILAYDEKRIHQLMRMYHAEKGFLASTAEWLNLHVDLALRKVAPWPADIRERIATFAEQQTRHDWPSEAGRKISVPAPIYGASGAMQ